MEKPVLAILEEGVMRDTETGPLPPVLLGDMAPSFQMDSEVSSRTQLGMNQAILFT